VPTIGSGLAIRVGQRVERWGVTGAVALGAVFALSFCPASAALFFGALMPLAVKHESPVWLPMVYGLGTAGPVVGFALVLTFGASALGRTFNRVVAFDRWARRITGVVFVLIGVYFILRFVFRVF
jgi:threonine/homoserine/homoserine lactone efflux protein